MPLGGGLGAVSCSALLLFPLAKGVAVTADLHLVTPSRLQKAWAELERCEAAWKACGFEKVDADRLAGAAAESMKWERLCDEWEEERNRLRAMGWKQTGRLARYESR